MKKLIILLVMININSLLIIKNLSAQDILEFNFSDTLKYQYMDSTYLTFCSSIIEHNVNFVGYQYGCNMQGNSAFLGAIWNNWGMTANPLDSSKYLFFTITAAQNIRLDKIYLISESPTVDDITNWEIIVDNYGSMITESVLNTDCNTSVIDISSVYLFTGQNATFRLFAGGGCCFNSLWSLNDLILTVLQIPLPIELISFTATENANNVKLEWITATETNNDYFIIERSKDLTFWEHVGMINGMGITSTQESYRLFDMDPLEDVSYYRLSQIDYDGKITYFEPVQYNNYTTDDASMYYDFLGKQVSTVNIKPGKAYIKRSKLGKLKKFIRVG